MSGNRFTGFILGAIAAVSYGLNPTFALPLYADGMNPDSVLLLRYGVAILILAVMVLARRQSFKVPRRSLFPLFVLGILMALSSLTLFLSYKYMASGLASTILFVYPILTAVIMALFFKEKVSWKTVLCLALAFGGILLLYKGPDGQTLSWIGMLLCIGSALSYALYLVGVNDKQLAGVPSLTLTFYVLCFGVLVFIGRLLVAEPLTLPSRWYLWFDAFALAVLPTAVSLICVAAAIQRIGSTPTAILGALEPVTAVVMGIILFGEGMSVREAYGIILILSAVSIVVARGGSGCSDKS